MTQSFEPFPYLITEHYFLRPLEQQDAKEILTLRSSDIVNKYLDRDRATSLDDALDYIKMIQQNVSANKTIYWTITKANEKHLLGTICLWNLDERTSGGEIGYELLPEHHGKGIMKEVLPVVIDYGFREMKLALIHAQLHRDNLFSLKLLERLGFKQEPAPHDPNNPEIRYKLEPPKL